MNGQDRRGIKPRLCHVVYGRYPADPRVRKEVETLARQGYAVDVLSLREEGRPDRETTGAVNMRRLPLGVVRGSQARYAFQYTLFFLLVAANIATASLTRRYRVIHVHSLPDFLVFAVVPARLLGTRVILDLHESMPHLYLARFRANPRSLLHGLTLVTQRLSCMVADEVITVNPVLAGSLRENGVPTKKTTVIENSPDWPAAAVERTVPSASPTTAFEIVIAGGLNRERDLALVLRAVKEVSATSKVQLRLVGPGDPAYVSELRRLILDLKLDQSVQIGQEVSQTEARELLALSSIGVVSYQRNPLTQIATPNKAYEYATLGRPMVVADLPGLRSLLGDSALYYRPGDSASLAAAIIRLKESPTLREELAGRASAVAHAHRWELMAERLVTLYSRLCGGATAPPGVA